MTSSTTGSSQRGAASRLLAALALWAKASHVAAVLRAPPVVVSADGGVTLRLLACHVERDCSEWYTVQEEAIPGEWLEGRLRHEDGDDWWLERTAPRRGDKWQRVHLTTTPDALFRLALDDDNKDDSSGARSPPQSAAPHWPPALLRQLERRGIAGEGTIAFDGAWFLSELLSSSMDRPLLLPDATSRLGLGGVERARDLMASVATTLRCGRVDVSASAFVEMLQRAGAAWARQHAGPGSFA